MKAKILLLVVCTVLFVANMHGAVVEFSTYLGGSESDFGSAMAIAPDGGIVVVLSSQSSALAGVTPFVIGPSGSSDIAVCKLAADGSTVEFLTFIGGSSADSVSSVAISPDGSIWVGGSTKSSDFPLVNPTRSIYQNDEVVLFKLASDGSALLFSTFFGGSGNDRSADIDIDGDGNVYFAGKTTSSDLPLLNEFQISPGDCFIGAMAPDGSLLFCSYLGEYNGDWSVVSDIALDAQTNILVCGSTISTSFPIHNAWQNTLNGSFDAFLMKISRSDWSVEFCTYLGGSGDDRGNAVASDSDSNIYMVGDTWAADFPLVNAFDNYYNGSEGYICRFTPDGQELSFSSFVGEYGYDYLYRVTVNSNDEAMVVGLLGGQSTSTAYYGWEYKASTRFQVFYARLASDVSGWVDMAAFEGTFVGDIAEGRNGAAIICGSVSGVFSFKNALQPVNAGGYDGFIACLSTNTVRCIPFIEDFEYGRMDAKWINLWEARTAASGIAHSGETELQFSPRTASQTYTAEVVLDLKGRSGIVFSFWTRSTTPERFTDVLSETFTGTGGGCGLAFSVDGNTWHKLHDITLASGLSTDYKQYTVDLDAALAAAGLSYDSPLHFKFHIKQNTYDPITYLYVDDISVVGTILNFQQDTVSIIEGSQGTFSVVRTGANEAACSVDYVTFPNTAQPDINYITTTGTLFFAEGQFTNTFTVETIDNGIENITYSFAVKLQNPAGIEVGIPNMCTVFITDDDESLVFPVRCSFESGVFNPIWNLYTEEVGYIQLNSNLSPPDGDNLVIFTCGGTYVDDGLAELTLPIDLAGLSNVHLSFYASRNSGDTADMIMPLSYTGHGRYVGVSISADGNTWYKLVGLSTLEGVGYAMQHFEISLDSLMASYGLTYTDSMYIRFSIGNTDVMGSARLLLDLVEIYSPSFDFETSSKTCIEYDGTQAFTVFRKGQTDNTASVQYSTRNGSAVKGEDFVDITGTLNFAAGQATNTINIDIQNDDASESDEVFYVDLLSPSTGFVIGNNGTVHVNIKDDERYLELPFQDNFTSDSSDWVTRGDVNIDYHFTGYFLAMDADRSDSLTSAAMLPVNPQGNTNIVLLFKAEYYPYSQTLMPNIYTGMNGGDGVAISADGVTWHKLLGFADDPAWTDLNEAEMTLDPFLSAAGITPGDPFKLRFEAYSDWRLYLDDVIVYSRMPLEISPEVLPNATGMVAYATSLICSNAITPNVWAEIGGLPDGLELSESGLLSGVPTEEGVFMPTFSVIDSFGGTGTGAVSLLVVDNSNRPPYATLKNPANTIVSMFAQTNRLFTLEAIDPESMPLNYIWEVNGSAVSIHPTNYLHSTVWGDAGVHTLDVRVSDGLWNNVLATWHLDVSGDNDGDGMSNVWEVAYGLDPWSSSDASEDPDSDGLVNTQEWINGTSPIDSDTNNDSLNDGWSVKYGYDPLNTNMIPRMTLTRHNNSIGSYFDWRDKAVAIDDTVYFAKDSWLKVFDVNDPDLPSVLCDDWWGWDHIYDIDIASNCVYMADGTNGIVKFDQSSDPHILNAVFGYKWGTNCVSAISVNGTLGLANIEHNTDTWILDLNDHSNSAFLGSLDTLNGWRKAVWSESFAYLIGGDDAFSVLDLTIPSSPNIRGSLPLPIGCEGQAVALGNDNTIFFSWDNYVGAVDVFNPDIPVMTVTNELITGTAYMDVGEITSMQNVGGFVFVGRNFEHSYDRNGLNVFDAASNSWNTTVASSSDDMRVVDLYATRNRVYVMDIVNGLVVYTYVGDYDMDGLPDSWEHEYFGSLAYGANDDPDCDGVINLGEWRASLNPLNGDSDGDLLSDGWEIRYLMDPDTADPVCDTDGDGLTDYEEQRCRTNPLNPSSCLVLEEMTSIDGLLGLCWQCKSGVTYRIDRSWNLSTWLPAPSQATPYGENPRMPMTDGVEEFVDEEYSIWSNIYYRLSVPE